MKRVLQLTLLAAFSLVTSDPLLASELKTDPNAPKPGSSKALTKAVGVKAEKEGTNFVASATVKTKAEAPKVAAKTEKEVTNFGKSSEKKVKKFLKKI